MPLSKPTIHQYTPGLHDHKTLHFSPDYIHKNPILIEIASLENGFPTIKNENIKKDSLKLTQTLCSENYFIYGGFNASKLTFKFFSEAMTDIAPEGKIQFSITPTQAGQPLTAEKVNLFTGYIDTAEPVEELPGMWTITAYDELYRLRNIDVSSLINREINSGIPPTWKSIKESIESQLHLQVLDKTPLWMNDILFPTNREASNVKGIDILRQFAFFMRTFGMIDGDGNLRYLHIKNWDDSFNDDLYFCINLFDPHNLEYERGQIWRPGIFTAEPRTNKFYNPPVENPNDIGTYNVYTIKNSDLLGDAEWIDKLYKCDENGVPAPQFNASNLPAGIFDTTRLNHAPTDIYECQGFSILNTETDPTIPMGAQLFVYKIDEEASTINWKQIVRSYVLKRRLNFVTAELITCNLEAENESYNTSTGEYDAGLDTAISIANRTRQMLPKITSAGGVENLKTIKTMTQAEYDALADKKSDTLYFVTGGTV